MVQKKSNRIAVSHLTDKVPQNLFLRCHGHPALPAVEVQRDRDLAEAVACCPCFALMARKHTKPEPIKHPECVPRATIPRGCKDRMKFIVKDSLEDLFAHFDILELLFKTAADTEFRFSAAYFMTAVLPAVLIQFKQGGAEMLIALK